LFLSGLLFFESLSAGGAGVLVDERRLGFIAPSPIHEFAALPSRTP